MHAEPAPATTPSHEFLPAEDPLRRCGYRVLRHPRPDLFPSLVGLFEQRLREHLAATGAPDTSGTFRIAAYHRYIEANGVDHHRFIQGMTRRLPDEWASHQHVALLIETAGAYFGRRLRLYRDTLEFRVVRPGKLDNNPLHRDHWFPYFRPLLNVYLPLCGSWCDSALKVVPFSHEWSDEEVQPTFAYGEQRKTVRDGVAYSVPEIKSCSREIVAHRPDVIPGDFMLFSPLLVHGGADNQSHETRFSLEFRLEFAS